FTLRLVGLMVALCGSWCAWRIVRRSVSAVPAALVAAATLVFGYLAYPSSMPTRWNLTRGVAAADLLLTFTESGRSRYIGFAGFLVGLGILIKSTGALVLFGLLIWAGSISRRKPLGSAFYAASALTSVAALALIAQRTGSPGALVGLALPW